MKSYYVVMTQLKQAIREYLNDSLGDFIEYARKHGVDIQVIKSENPDTFKKIFGEPCEDAISRQAVLDTIGNVPDYDDGMVWEALSHAQRDVALLPSVKQEPKTGHWIDEGYYAEGYNEIAYRCSECGYHVLRYADNKPLYCEACGSKME